MTITFFLIALIFLVEILMPVLSQDINMLLNSPHPPWEAERTHVVLFRLNWALEDQGIISPLSSQCEGP